MPANQGEWVVGAAGAVAGNGRTAAGSREAVVVIFASSWEILRCSSLSPARTAASSELTSPLCGGRIDGELWAETRRAIRSAISRV